MAGPRVGLIVRSAPFAGRSGRDQLDIALAAATLGFEIELYFVGNAVLQLNGHGDPEAAGLPGGVRGWRSLPELTRVSAWACGDAFRSLSGSGEDWALDVHAATEADISARLAGCDKVLVV